ncbi:hypothetical protein PCANC_15281 [Puccinia coronata f. sp. avenae]|uniref:Uncharacterized protein n=1 Tax=Puccinia coronata f. sp. avenae TaxID=200324 RepID=A0A2N5UIK6_9BASI|nr:hypothetical protein PCANC_15281 [Puccinia coronata f. sp. avenae]
MDGNCGEHYNSKSGYSHNSHPNLGYDHPPPGNQHHGDWYNPHAYGGHPNPYGGHAFQPILQFTSPSRNFTKYYYLSHKESYNGYYDEFEHGIPNGIGLTNNCHHLRMGPDMSNWMRPTVTSPYLGNSPPCPSNPYNTGANHSHPNSMKNQISATNSHPAIEHTSAAKRTPATPAAEQTPAAPCTPVAAERTPAAESTQAAKHTPVAQRTLAAVRTPAATRLPASERLAGRMIACRTSTRKFNQSHAEINTASKIAAAKRAEKACQTAQNAKAKRQKAFQKDARVALKTAAGLTTRFLWSEEGTLEALRYIKNLKEEHDRLSLLTPGFIKWSPFVLKYTGDMKDDFLLIKDFSNEVIQDSLLHSGSGGLYETLLKHKMDEDIYHFIVDMHGDNPAANGGHMLELDNPYDDLAASHTNNAEFNDGSARSVTSDLDADGITALATPNSGVQPVEPASGAASVTQDATVNPDSGAPSVTGDPTVVPASGKTSVSGNPAVVTTSAATSESRGPSNVPVSGATSVSSTTSASRSSSTPAPPPSRLGTGTSRRHGRTEEVKPNDSVSTSMLSVMQKSQETTFQWMADERKQAEELCSKEKTLAIKNAEERAHARQVKENQMECEKAKYEDDWKAQDEDQKEEHRQAHEWRVEESKRYEAAQQRMAEERQYQEKLCLDESRSRQAFKTTMLSLLGNLAPK